MSVRIAVLIVTRDRPTELIRCLQSIFNQTYRNFEVHVLDDGSGDRSIGAELDAYFDDGAVRYCRVNQSVGATQGRNLLAKHARGDVFCFLDDDAYFENHDSLQRLAESFEQYDEMGVAALQITDYRKQAPRLLLPYRRWTLRRHPELRNRPGKVSYYLGCGFAVRREAFTACDGFEPFLYYGEDELDFSYRVLEEGYEIRYVPDVQIAHVPGTPLLAGKEGKGKLYYHVRNRFYLLYRYIPAKYAFSYALVWGTVYTYFALRHGRLGSTLQGLVAGLKGLPMWSREPISPQVVRYLRENHGRLWY